MSTTNILDLNNRIDELANSYPASKVMMQNGESVENGINTLTKSTFGRRVSIDSYTDSNQYECPSDGYALLGADGTERSGTIKVNGYAMINVVAGSPALMSVFVRKGSLLSCSLAGTGTVAYFYPLS